jgi:oligopeptide/dipeptide ABC transporter ATP-binding protein
VLLAMTLAAQPKLLIADEPTSAVDDELRSEINALIKQARDRYGLSLLWITHNPEDVTALADKVLVFYAGQLVEEAPADRLMMRPLHPYTQQLLACTPAKRGTKTLSKRLPVFSGAIASAGCSFAPRCPDRMPLCSEEQPPLVQLADNRRVRCLRYAG